MSAPGAARPIRHLRWYVAGLLCLAAELNYLDRQVLSVLAGTLERELGIGAVEYSFITSSFLVSYTVMYAVAGRIVDRLGTRRSFLLFVAAWSAASMLHALAATALQLAACRFLLGAAEAANFPAGAKAVAEWFPMRERALALGLFNAGASIGAAVAIPLAGAIAVTWGWQHAFLLTGALGAVWLVAWAAIYRSPSEHRRLGVEERRLIEGSRASPVAPAPPPSVRALLARRDTWGCILVRGLTDPVTYFLIFWVPRYLEQERGLRLQQIGATAWIPFAALALGGVAGGAASRLLVARGLSVNAARKAVMLAVSCLLPVGYLAVTRVGAPAAALALLAALMFGHTAWGNITLPAEVFPSSAVATVTGLGGALGGAVGIASQVAIGHVVERLSYAPVFAACAGVYLAAFAVVQLLVGPLGTARTLRA
jgi:MFS transporter, ACS family, hexuronate transporter